MICSEGYKAFRGTMRIVPKNPSMKPYELTADWLYKPEYQCWYGKGSSFPEVICEVMVDLTAQTPNEPLTLEELRKMGLLEWLWVEVVHPSQRQLFRNVTSAYYQIYTDYTDGEALCCGWPGIIHEFEYGDYGKTWLAYRNKPVEVAP